MRRFLKSEGADSAEYDATRTKAQLTTSVQNIQRRNIARIRPTVILGPGALSLGNNLGGQDVRMDANEAEADAGHQEIHVQEAQPPPLLGAPTGGLDNGRMAIANLINSVQGDQDHAARSGNSPRDEDVPTAAQNSGVITNHGLHASVSKPPRKRKRSASDPFEGFEEFWQLVERVEEADIELDEKELELDECNLKLKELHSQMMLELAKMSELRKQKAAAQDRRRAALADQEALLHRAHLSPMQLFELGRRVEENTKRSKDDSK